jgi:hypothetical protein
MLTENTKFKHYRTDKTAVHVSDVPNVLITDNQVIFLRSAPRMLYHVDKKNGRQKVSRQQDDYVVMACHVIMQFVL